MRSVPNSFRAAVTAAALLVGNGRTAVASVLMNNALAATPQMGWDNWNAFGCDVSESLLLDTASRIVSLGLRDAGYHYVVLDDCWSDGRFENNSLKPDFSKFPNGMKYVADSLHAMGLGFGMYSSAGFYTCAQYAGSLGYEDIDAQAFADWGVDYLKYDNCYNGGQSGTANISYARYEKMHTALNNTGREILYSMCNWGQDQPWNWAYSIANSWRATGDIFDSFDRQDPRCPCQEEQGINCALPGFHCSVMNIINKVAWFVHQSQPGGWNDLDGLEVGNGGMSDSEYVLHMTFWAALKSPLIMGADIRSLSGSAYSIYTNPAILALSQDPLGTPAQRVWRYYVSPTDSYGEGEIQLWSGPLSQGDQMVILLNAANQDLYMNATLADIFVDDGGAKSAEANTAWDIYDLWANRMPNVTANAVVNSNSTTLGATGVNSTAPTAYLYNATATSYAQGIQARDPILMGKHVSTVQANGILGTLVPRHGVVAYRLVSRSSTSSKRRRDEL